MGAERFGARDNLPPHLKDGWTLNQLETADYDQVWDEDLALIARQIITDLVREIRCMREQYALPTGRYPMLALWALLQERPKQDILLNRAHLKELSLLKGAKFELLENEDGSVRIRAYIDGEDAP